MTTNDDANKEADFIIVLSSEMISDIVQRYLNSEMFKQQVSVVDTKPTESGYAFGVCFTVQAEQVIEHEINTSWIQQFEGIQDTSQPKRNRKGMFTKKEQK